MDYTYNCYGGCGLTEQIKKIAGGTFIGMALVVGVVLLITIGMGIVIYNSLSEDMSEDGTYAKSSEVNIGGFVREPNMDLFTDNRWNEEDDPLEQFKPDGQMLKTDPNAVEVFQPPSTSLIPHKEPESIDKFASEGSYGHLYGGQVPGFLGPLKKLYYDRIVPFNQDILEYVWDQNANGKFSTLRERQSQLMPKPLLNGATKKAPAVAKAIPKDAIAKKEATKKASAKAPTNEKFDPNAIVSGKTEGMSFYLLPPENTDRNIVGCPKIFPVFNGAYQKIYVMSANDKQGNLIYEYYGRSKAEARLKFRQAFPGCELPDSIKVTTRRAEIPSTT